MIQSINDPDRNTRMNVLLISLNRYAQPYPVFPLGMAYVAAALEQSGCTVGICDCNLEYDRIETIVNDFNADCIGISIRNIDDVHLENNTYFVPELCDIVSRLKRVTDVPLILGGSAYSLFPETLLQLSGADFGIVGEGEESICLLVEALGRNAHDTSRFTDIPALVYYSKSGIVINSKRVIDPTKMYHPLRPPALLEYYMKKSSVVNIQTQRGCPFKCCYCTYPLIEGASVRKRDAAQVVDEIETLVASGGDYFFIVDSVFNIKNDHVAAFCEELIRRNVTCAWSCFLRPHGLTSDLMGLMKQAGLSHIEFGTDSMCDAVLESYGKNFTFDDVVESSEFARIHNVHYAHFLIAGGPGETEQTLRTGFENSKKLKKTVFFPFTGMRVFPGTALYQRALNELVIEKQCDCLEPIFYISPSLSGSGIRKLHEEFHTLMPNWIIDDPTESIKRVMEGLRKKGIRGPLWEFLAR